MTTDDHARQSLIKKAAEAIRAANAEFGDSCTSSARWDTVMAEAAFAEFEAAQEPIERDIEYRDRMGGTEWLTAILGASDRQVRHALAENKRLAWQKYRISEVRGDDDDD